MQLRAVQEFVVHLESFRNIDIWYQGAYLVRLRIVPRLDPLQPAPPAHPFAHTEHYYPENPDSPHYDSQVLKPASIDHPSSSFLSKAFLLRYYE
jgi:hypothetical protein